MDTDVTKTRPGTIVVGVDGSESSREALLWAADQAVAEARPLTLVHAISAVTPAYMDIAVIYPQEALKALRVEGHAVLSAARSEVEGHAPGLEVDEVFRIADPREVLLELSRTATMLVLGSRGRGRLSSLLLGSVGVALVRHAHCPVVVHRPGNPGIVRDGVVVGADGTEDSRIVLEFAYREASLRRLPLTVLQCYWDAGASAVGAYYAPDPAVDVSSEKLLLAESIAGMSEKYPDVVVETHVARGHPQTALVRLSERTNLVVVGAHQDGLAARILFGSVSIAVVEHATCPVAVVPVLSAR